VARPRRNPLTTLLIILACVGAWLLVTQVLMPKLGIPT
jgi:hypothetical protein